MSMVSALVARFSLSFMRATVRLKYSLCHEDSISYSLYYTISHENSSNHISLTVRRLMSYWLWGVGGILPYS
jgi:hypothetical protein